MGITPPKKKRRYDAKYLTAWEQEFDWIGRSHKGHDHAYCKICNRHFRIDHGGRNDLKKHSQTSIHESSIKAQKTSSTVTRFFASQEDDDIIRSEVLFANFVAEHNLAFNVADHFNKLCKQMFHDSKIAHKFSCGRTKTTQIVKRSLAPTLEKEVIEHCKQKPFSLACDESNDRDSEKTLAIVVRYFTDRAVTRFLAMPICNIGTGENIFSNIQQVFVDHEIPWKNLIAFVSDNCSVMTGKHNSVISRIKIQRPEVFDLGCVCHLANLCTLAGVKCIPLPVDDLLVDIFYHFHHSAKRKEQYKEFLDFCDVEPSKLVKHCSTRWLSLQRSVERLLHHWPALLSYFKSHDDVEKPGRIKRVASLLDNPEMKLYCLFLAFILPFLNDFNTMFQADAVRIGFLKEEMVRLLRRFLGKFVKARVIMGHPEDITCVPYKDPENQLEDNIMAVGPNTRTYIAVHHDDFGLSTEKNFFRSVRQFYVSVVTKMVDKFPFDDPVVNSLGFLNPARRVDIAATDVSKLAIRFQGVVSDIGQLEEEFIDFQLTPDSELPPFNDGVHIDIFWGDMCGLRNRFTNTQRFPNLSALASAMCAIPNSNADCERIFSMVRKIQTDQRGSMDNSTLECLLRVKINNDSDCFNFKPTKDILRSAKSACVEYNKDLLEMQKR